MSELAVNSPTERAEELIRLTRRLTGLIEKETALFNDKRPQDALAFQDEKSKLATLYRRETQLAAKDPARLSGLPGALKQTLVAATERFESAVAENGLAVSALKLLTEGMVKAIADEAVRQKQASSGYGPTSGSTGTLGSIAVNQSA